MENQAATPAKLSRKDAKSSLLPVTIAMEASSPYLQIQENYLVVGGWTTQFFRILVNIYNFPHFFGENKKCFKPTSRILS